MTTEESMESLDRAVEEARNGWHRAEESPDFIVWRYYEDGECHGAVTLPKEVEAAVSAKARAEERERYENYLITTWVNLKRENQLRARNLLMAAVGGPIICGVCGEEAGNG